MRPSSSDSLRAGARLGSYRIERVLGRGGMGTVYEAVDDALGRRCALKVVLGRHASDRRFLDRFRREGQAAVAVAHPGVTRVYAAGVEGGVPFMAVELVTGGSLEERIRGGGAMPWREAAEMGARVARALAAVHAAGFVHRDLKPANVLLDESGAPKLTDFGLVREQIGADTAAELTAAGLTKTGELVGTPDYMAPEQIEGTRAVGPAADLYALGLLLFELVTGARAFREASLMRLLRAHLEKRPPAPSDVAVGVPPAYDDLVARLLAKSPSDRPASAEQVADELDALTGRSAEDVWEGSKRDRGPLMAALIGLAVVIGLCAAALIATRPGPAPPPIERPAAAAPERSGPPPWYLALVRQELARPELPLPDGVVFGENPREYVVEKDGTVLVWVPPGGLVLGWDGDPDDPDAEKPSGDEHPEVRLELSAYFIGKHEVSRAQFARFVEQTGHVTLAESSGEGGRVQPWPFEQIDRERSHEHWSGLEKTPAATWRDPNGDGRPPPPDHPVTQVARADAIAYAQWAGLRLPTEPQWERAAGENTPRHIRRNGRRRYPWGGEPEPLLRAGRRLGNLRDESVRPLDPSYIFGGYDDGHARTAPVGSFPEGASPFGARDMAGNVWEWCRDYYLYHYHQHLQQNATFRDPLMEPTMEGIVPPYTVRGGSFNTAKKCLRVSFRSDRHGEYRSNDLGFRVVLEVGP